MSVIPPHLIPLIDDKVFGQHIPFSLAVVLVTTVKIGASFYLTASYQHLPTHAHTHSSASIALPTTHHLSSADRAVEIKVLRLERSGPPLPELNLASKVPQRGLGLIRTLFVLGQGDVQDSLGPLAKHGIDKLTVAHHAVTNRHARLPLQLDCIRMHMHYLDKHMRATRSSHLQTWYGVSVAAAVRMRVSACV